MTKLLAAQAMGRRRWAGVDKAGRKAHAVIMARARWSSVPTCHGCGKRRRALDSDGYCSAECRTA